MTLSIRNKKYMYLFNKMDARTEKERSDKINKTASVELTDV